MEWPKLSKKLYPKIGLLLLIIGLGLRLNVYFQDRSFIIDEANLARNIVEKDFAGFFQNLDYEQYAPPLFASVAKVNILLFGTTEWALKLLPLLAGLFSLILLYLLSYRYLKSYPARWYLLLLFGFSILAIRYSTEFKQYSVDAALGLFLLAWAYQSGKKPLDWSQILQWTFAGGVLIWLSMPVIFVLASIGLYFLYKTRKDRKHLLSVFLMGIVWVASFGSYYFSILAKDAGSDYLQNYHANYFFSFLPDSYPALLQSLKIVRSILASVGDQTVISIAWIGFLLLSGFWQLIRQQRGLAFLLAMPIFFCLLASHLHLYSLIPRLTLFMMPLLLLILGKGLDYWWQRSNALFRFLMFIPILISVINKKGYEYFWTQMEYEDSKTVLAYIAEHKVAKEGIYVIHEAKPAFIFYNEMHKNAYQMSPYYLANWDDLPAQVLPNTADIPKDNDFWLFSSHRFPIENVQQLVESASEIARLEEEFVSIAASGYHFTRK